MPSDAARFGAYQKWCLKGSISSELPVFCSEKSTKKLDVTHQNLWKHIWKWTEQKDKMNHDDDDDDDDEDDDDDDDDDGGGGGGDDGDDSKTLETLSSQQSTLGLLRGDR